MDTMSIATSPHILTVASEYKNHRGGIGSVVATYSHYFTRFKFVATYPAETVAGVGGWIGKFLQGVMRLGKNLIADRAIRIVHIHSAAKGSFYRNFVVFLISRYGFGKKVIFHSHGSEMKAFYEQGGPLTRSLCRFLFGRVSLIICLSEQWEAFFKENFKPKRITILENIVPRPHVNRSLQPKPPAPAVTFLFLGLIGGRKGVFDLVEAVGQHAAALRGKARFVIGGNGETQKLTDLIERNQLQDLISFKGWVSGAAKEQLLAEADVYVLPSYNEGLPISILEAMSYGMPVIATKVGGIPRVVCHGGNGLLIDAGDCAALSDAVLTLTADASLRREMGRMSLRLVQPYFAQNVIDKLNQIYNSMLYETR